MKKITVRDLTKAGFTRVEEYDFKDDGNSFKFYQLAGIPVSYLKKHDLYFISIRTDYLGVKYNKEKSKIENEFNGVETVNIEKLVQNIYKVKEMIGR